MRTHFRMSPISCAIRTATAIGIALTVGVLGIGGTAAAAPPAATQTHANFSGTWGPEGRSTEEGIPIILGVTEWAPLSQGKPEDAKWKTYEEQAEWYKHILANKQDLFVEAMKIAYRPPLTPAGQAAMQQVTAAMMKQPRTSTSMCTPHNIVGGFGFGPVEISASGNRVLVVIEGSLDGSSFRLFYLDGRGHDQSLPSWVGHSVGHWEGNKLVVETTNFKGDTAMMGFAIWPLSPQAKLTETFTLSKNGKTLAIKEIYEDPTYIKEPVARMVYLQSQPDIEPLMSNCLETAQGIEEFSKEIKY